MKSILLLFALIAGSSSVWAETTLTENFSSSNATSNQYDCASAISTAANRTDWDYAWTPSGSGTVFKNGIKLGARSATGTVTNTTILNGIATGTSITIKVYAARWSSDTGSLVVTYNSKSETKAPANSAITSTSNTYSSDDFSSSTDFTITKVEDVTSFSIASSAKRILIDKVEVVYNEASLPSAGLAFPVPSFKVSKDLNDFPTPTLTNPNGVTVEYSSSNEDVALVDENTGYVALCGEAGTTTITATFTGNSSYAAGTATYTITTYDPAANDGSEAKPYTVTEALALIDALADNGSTSAVYVKGKVKNVEEFNSTYNSLYYYIEDLDDDTKSLYVYSGKNLGNTNFTATSDLTVGDELTIYGSLKKYVKNSTTTPEINQNNFITQYKHGTEPEVKSLQVNAAAYRTYVASANLVVPTGVKAFIATSSSADELTLTSVPKIKEGTPVILNATEGYYSFEITDETVTYPNANLLKISDGTVTNGVYVLAKKGDDVKFYKWAGGALSPGKVYVEAPSSSAREYLDFVFDNEATAIETVKTNKVDGQYYNLAGQRVANPTKGLYIVNGNKVIITLLSKEILP